MHGIHLDRRNFTIQYESTIPGLVGMAGSSAIVTATYRALQTFYGVSIPKPELANIIRSTEEKELGIAAGLQDRVIQVYGGLVYMDFNRELLEGRGYGDYIRLDPTLLPPVYVAYRTDLAEGSEVLHSRLRDDFEAGVPQVIDAMHEWAQLTVEVKHALGARDFDRIPALLNRNFDLRCEVCGSAISAKNRRMVELARSTGASAKFTGSGGAIIGTYTDEAMFRELSRVLGANRIDVIKPEIVSTGAAR